MRKRFASKICNKQSLQSYINNTASFTRYIIYYIWKETRSSVLHYHQLCNSLYMSFIYKLQQHSKRILSSNKTRAIYKTNQNILSNMSLTLFMSDDYYVTNIKAMFVLQAQIFKAICTPSYQIYDKQNQILKQLWEQEYSQYSTHFIPNM